MGPGCISFWSSLIFLVRWYVKSYSRGLWRLPFCSCNCLTHLSALEDKYIRDFKHTTNDMCTLNKRILFFGKAYYEHTTMFWARTNVLVLNKPRKIHPAGTWYRNDVVLISTRRPSNVILTHVPAGRSPPARVALYLMAYIMNLLL